jgi:ribosomal protein S18 acetylase RimI-like enzyme
MNKKIIENKKNNIQIRRAQVNDAPILAKVHVESWQKAYQEIVPESFLKGFTYLKRKAAFREALINKTEETYIAEEGDNIVGILTIGASRDSDLDNKATGEIWGIYLLSDYWRRGIGAFLVNEGESILRNRGHKDIVLWVLEANTAARNFYEAMGYVLDGKEKTVNLGKELVAIRYHKFNL